MQATQSRRWVSNRCCSPGLSAPSTYSGRVEGNLLAATQVFIEVIYRFDGQTYGSLPNRGEWLTQGQSTCRSSFGDDAMRQLFILQKL